jgi:excisionase family DNA binding protein
MAATVRIPTPDANRSNGPRLGRSVSIDHAAQLLGVSRRTVYNRIREGRLLTIRTLGGSQRVLIESLSAPPAISPRSFVPGFGG